MDFVIQWVCYLLAFLLGSLVAWLLAVVSITHTRVDDANADLAGSTERGAGS